MKEKCLQTLKDARQAHLNWVRKATMLTDGLEFSKEAIPVDSTACEFGRWFYERIESFSMIEAFKSSLDDIEQTHALLHKEYQYIYEIYYTKDEKQGFWKKLFSKELAIDESQKLKAKEHLKTLKEISLRLSKYLDTFARQIHIADDDELLSLYSNL